MKNTLIAALVLVGATIGDSHAAQQCFTAVGGPTTYGAVDVTVSGSSCFDSGGAYGPYPAWLIVGAGGNCALSFSHPIAASSISIGIESLDNSEITVATSAGAYTSTAADIASPLAGGVNIGTLSVSGTGYTHPGAGEGSGTITLTNGAPNSITSLTISQNPGLSGTFIHVCADDATPPPTYTVGGTASGLGAAESVELLNNGGDNLTVAANGAFTFATGLNDAASYSVSVNTAPAGKNCTVGNGSGTISGANVTNVTVSCAPITYSVGGTVSGLGIGESVVLLDNGGDNLTVAADGAFTFATGLANGASYSVSVGAAPVGKQCSVGNGSGTISGANVTNVAVACSGAAVPALAPWALWALAGGLGLAGGLQRRRRS